MKIDGFGGSGKIEKSKSQSKSSKAKSKSSSGANPTVADRIEVSDHMETLDVIRSLVNETPDVRMDEVDRIVRQLREGRYKLNFEKVAEGFIKEAILNEMSKRTLGK